MKGGNYLMKYKPKRSVFKSFKKTVKLLDVAAENEVQHFIENPLTIDDTVIELLDPIVSVTFNRVVLLQDKAIVQGEILKNLIYKDDNNDIVYFEEGPILFGIDVNLPGLTPGFTIGKFNRLIRTNNFIDIGPDNQGTNGGIDIQIYLTNFFTFQQIIEVVNGTTNIDQKIVIEFIIKVSKYTQQELDLPESQAIFECRNVQICNDFKRPVSTRDDHKRYW